MNSKALIKVKAPSDPHDLARVLEGEGEEEYLALRRILQAAQGHFTLLPVESNFTQALRDAFFERLRSDLTEQDVRLRVLTLSHDTWNLFQLPEMETPVSADEVVILTGLED